VAATLCQAAWEATRKKDCYLSARFRRLAARRGMKRVVMAVAHTILIIAYTMLKPAEATTNSAGIIWSRSTAINSSDIL
jgi:transposase